MSKWLLAAKNEAAPCDKTDKTDKTQSMSATMGAHAPESSVSSVLSIRQKTPYASQAGGQAPVVSDEEAYAAALRAHGPCGYGVVARALGWGATRAGQVEERLRKDGRIFYDRTGRGWLVEEGGRKASVESEGTR